MAGTRLERMAGTFDVSKSVHLLQKSGREVLVTGELKAERDCLDGIPII
jgi:hypothetical protein